MFKESFKPNPLESKDEDDYWVLRNEVKKDLKVLVDFEIKWWFWIPVFGSVLLLIDCILFRVKVVSPGFYKVLYWLDKLCLNAIIAPLTNLISLELIGNFLGSDSTIWQQTLVYLLAVIFFIYSLWSVIIPIIFYRKKAKKIINFAVDKLDLKDEVQEYEEHRQKSIIEKMKLKWSKHQKKNDTEL